MMRINILLFGLTMVCFQAIGQQTNPKISFTGTGRAWIDQDNVSGSAVKDTTRPKQANTGYVLLDLGINVRPTQNTLINATIRARNEFGGFYGSGATVRIRQLFMKGIIAKKVNYQIGDIDLNQSKYTLWNYAEEGQVNEASAFSIPRSIIYYENFYTSNNTWRVQGVQSDFAFSLGNAIEKIKIDGSISRVQTGTTGVQKFIGGGSLSLKQSKWFGLGINYMNTFEIAGLSATQSAFSNPVITGVLNIGLTHGDLKTSLASEFGKSSLRYSNYTGAPSQVDGGLFEASAKAVHEPSNITLNIAYRNVSNTFFSAGAQTRRMNYDAYNNLFPTLDALKTQRMSYLWDMTRDPNLYNRTISQSLMTYNPLYSNALPYGNATPNRQGVTLDLTYSEKNNKTIDGFLTAAFLSDIVGQGTLKQKQYMLLKLGGNLYINRLLSIEKKIKFNVGLQSDNANRPGEAFEEVKFSSNLLDLGFDVEVVKKLEILLGLKYLGAKGNEFVVVRDAYNQVSANNGYNRVDFDQIQTMIGGGLKYSFSEKVYLTLQNHFTMIKDNKTSQNTSLNQLYMLFNMTF